MAKNDKNLDKALNNAIDDLLKNFKGAMREAVNFAVKQAEQDIMQKAKTCLQEYYDNYEPNSYHRTYSLQDAFLPYKNIKNTNDKISGSVGVKYDAKMLTTYNVGSNNYGNRDIDTGKEIIPINEWILQNYLMGIHPSTNGSSVLGESIYFQIIDPISPNEKMAKFIKSYDRTFDENILLGLLGQIAKKM